MKIGKFRIRGRHFGSPWWCSPVRWPWVVQRIKRDMTIKDIPHIPRNAPRGLSDEC